MGGRIHKPQTATMQPPSPVTRPPEVDASHGNAAMIEAMRASQEPAWSRDLGRQDQLGPATAAAARELGLCTVETDQACLERLPESDHGRALLASADAVRRETTPRPHTTAARAAAPVAPYRERVGGNDLQNVEVGDDGVHIHVLDLQGGDGTTTARGPNASLHLGQINERDSESDARQWGVRAEAGLASVTIGDDDTGVDLNTPHAEAEASIGERGLVLDAGGSLLDADGRARFEDAGDTRLNYGLGAEGRFALRVPIEDTDHDGCPEVGVRVSAGIGTLGFTTEGACRPNPATATGSR